MAYVALYRKWRPKTFKDVIGQDHIVKTLKNQIKAGRLGHAYLFCGTRGTGKTTTAKIFAKVVNCQSPIEGEPCNSCDACDAANSGQGINVIEIDAASNNSVDNIREIREEVKYTPTKGKYKVYIIDEVHMLSVGAFNALLKTLEEPPAHVIFILATTEPHKILPTILSRCQRYDFKRIQVNEIVAELQYYMKEEGVNIEEKAIHYIASLADGSMRDALSILDQCIAFYLGKEITIDKVLDLLGAVDQSVFFEMTKSLYNKESLACIELLDKVMEDGRDLSQFILDLIKHLRNLLVIQTTGGKGEVLDMSLENVERLKSQSKEIPYSEIVRYIHQLAEIESSLKYATQKRILVEVALIKLCQLSSDASYEALLSRLTKVEEQLKKGVQVVHMDKKSDSSKKKLIQPTKAPKAVSEDVKKAVKQYGGIKERLVRSNPSMLVVLDHLTVGYISDDILYLICENKYQINMLKDQDNRRLNEISQVYEDTFGKNFNIQPITREDYDRLHASYYGHNTVEMDNKDEEDIDKLLNTIDFPVEIRD